MPHRWQWICQACKIHFITIPFFPFHVHPLDLNQLSYNIYIFISFCLGGEPSPLRSPDPPALGQSLPEDVAEDVQKILQMKTLVLGEDIFDEEMEPIQGEECEEANHDHNDSNGPVGGDTSPPPEKKTRTSSQVSPSLQEIAESEVWGLLK